jgi:hypothetical protein
MRKWFIRAGVVLAILLIIACIALYFATPAIRNYARGKMQVYLQNHFHGSVQFSDFQISVYPVVRGRVTGVVVRHNGRTDIQPMLRIRAISFETATLKSILSAHLVIDTIRLEGLQIATPPRHPGGPPVLHPSDQDLASKYPILIHHILADDATLVILRVDRKTPKEYDIHHLDIKDFNFSEPAAYQATLTNAIPRGEIATIGKFGPWRADEPSETPFTGSYDFENADMSTLKGLKGTLSSTGKYSGPLDYLYVVGETDVPDFELRISDHPMDLKTSYSAIVDGTNGNTYLNEVDAHFLHTTLHVKGEVVDLNKQIKSRTIRLNAVSDDARIEDLLLLAVKSEPPVMSGTASLKADIDIPEGNEDLIERLKIDGQFGVGEAKFSSSSVQGKIDSLSRRGQGKPKDMEIEDVASELQGSFKVANSRVNFSDLSFGVPGASISLIGNYNMDNGALDFRGKLRLKAKLSQTTTGVKSFFLKAVDPFFKKNGAGTEIPIKITGTKDHPSFGPDFHDPANK